MWWTCSRFVGGATFRMKRASRCVAVMAVVGRMRSAVEEASVVIDKTMNQ